MKTKQIALFILILAIPTLIFAQANPLDEMISQYSEKDGFYFLDLKTNLMSKKDEQGNKSNDKVIVLKMLSFDSEQNSSYTASNIYKQFFKSIDNSQYKGVVEVKSSGDNVEMLVRKEGDKLAEVIIAVQEEKEMTIIAASGNFDMKDLSQFENMEKCHGMQLINQLCEE